MVPAVPEAQRWQEPALSTLGNERGHVGYLGHLALILAVRETSFPGGPHRALLGKLTLSLARKMEHGPCGLAETYPGELYVPDNAVALAAVALAARAGVTAQAAPALPLPLGLSPAATGFAIASARRLSDT